MIFGKTSLIFNFQFEYLIPSYLKGLAKIKNKFNWQRLKLNRLGSFSKGI